MKKIETIDEVHHIILNIGKAVHEICTRNNIPYYMIGGTMLGAIRHKGFIPWDDDMDFGIPRRYFQKAINTLRKELPPKYSVKTIEDGTGIWGEMVKIEDNTTVIKEIGRDTKGQDAGIFIDLFPLDYTRNQNYSRFSYNMFIQRIIQAQMFVLDENVSGMLPKLYKLIAFLFGKHCFIRLLKYVNKKNGFYITNFCGMYGERENMPSHVFGNPTLYFFEGTEFYGVAKPETFLTNIYGDWRKLPKEEDRHIHLMEMYYK